MSTDSAAQSEDMATETESSGGLFEAGASGNVGVLGYSDRLILVVSRVPKAQSVQPAGNSMGAEDTGEALTDLCRITYWFVDNGDGERGLARHETTRVTSTDEAVPPNVGDPQKYIIADQVSGSGALRSNGLNGGDSRNDMDLLEVEGVVPRASSHCPGPAELTLRCGGVVSTLKAPEEVATIDCTLELARRGFYGPLSDAVREIAAASVKQCRQLSKASHG